MIAGIAWRNFYRQGVKAFLNVFVTAASIVAVVFMLSMINGAQAQATRNVVSADTAGGHYRVPGFDILTPTEWEDFIMLVPESLHSLPHGEKAEVLLVQGQIYPNRRLYPVQLRGVETEQTLLNLPFDGLRAYGDKIGDVIPAVLGVKMARNAHLKKGDTVILKWRDRFGAADAREIYIVDVADLLNPRIDEGIVWLRLDHLREITRRPGEVTWVAVRNFQGEVQGFEFHSVFKLMEDLLNLLKHDRRNSKIMWTILMFLAGISVFNTQIMSIFKRQKEIGTFMAMGMLPRQIVGMFVLEGGYTALCAVLTACLFGIPFFVWFQGVGFDVSHLNESTIPVRERIYPAFDPGEIFNAVAVVVGVIVLSAWLPVRKIARLDPTRALRGKAIV